MSDNDLLQLPIYTAPSVHGEIDVPYAHAGQGDLVLLVHGSLCDLRYWRWQLKLLPKGCHVVALSLPGCWPDALTASTPNAFEFEAHVNAVADVVEALRQPQQRLYVLGHSRGAQIAAQYAYESQATIDGLILADAAFCIDQTTPPLAVIQQAAEQLMQGEDDKGLRLFIDAVNGDHTWDQMVSWFKTMVQDNAITLIPQSQESLPVVTQSQIHALRDMPMLLINGENSPKRYQNSHLALLQELPAATQRVIKNASHGMNLAKPKTFNQMITDFISQKNAL